MFIKRVVNEPVAGDGPDKHAYEVLKTRLRWRIRRAQQAVGERKRVELSAAKPGRQ
jgi:hypothetical protein